MWRTLEEIFDEPAELRIEQSPSAFLDSVRERSCYKTFRLCIDLAVVAGWIGGSLAAWLRFSDSTNSMILAGVLMVLLAIALSGLRQSALVVVDIADVLIEQNRRK